MIYRSLMQNMIPMELRILRFKTKRLKILKNQSLLRGVVRKDCLEDVSFYTFYSSLSLVFGGEEEDLDANVKKEQELFEKTLNDIIEFQKSHTKKLSLAEKTALAHLKIKMLEQKEAYMKAQKKAK